MVPRPVSDAASQRNAALAAERAGRPNEATTLFRRATDAHPFDAALLNSAGSFHARQRDHIAALAYFDRALRQSPAHGEAIVNRAITLAALDRKAEALEALRSGEPNLANDPRYWSARAGIERERGELSASARSYERCLALNPRHPRALHGRARTALERGEPGTVARYKQALASDATDAELWLGLAQAMEAEGDLAGARSVVQTLVEQAPGWIAALELLAQLRWSSGDDQAFCDHYLDAARRRPADPEIFRSWCRMLAGVDRFAQAADIAATARTRFPGLDDLALVEAARAGEAGDDDRAETIFSALTLDTDERLFCEARHLLRRRKPSQAASLLERVLANQPDNIGAWALLDIAWRLLGDPRHDWLHRQVGLVSVQPLGIHDDEYRQLVALLESLHARSSWPIGQSVRNGTQTRGGLFERQEREVAMLAERIATAVERHRIQLPAVDEAHPLLRHRDGPMRLIGSWSIRLTGAGKHTEHIHPQGILSSAAHLIVPPPRDDNDMAGALELGRSPPDLRLDLPPVATFSPRAGHCVLFPSTLYHGTRAFSEGERLSVAFDVAPA